MTKNPVYWDRNFIRYKEKYIIVAMVSRVKAADFLAELKEPMRWEIGTLIEKHEEKSVTIQPFGQKRVTEDVEEGIQSAFQYGKDVVDGKIAGARWLDGANPTS